MYFFYLDESGSRDPDVGTPEKPKDHLYVLLAVGMFEGQWPAFDREIGLLKLELADHIKRNGKGKFDLADCEVKSNWIRNLHKKAYEFLLERIDHFMSEYHPKHNALIVMDDTSRQLNRAVAMKHAWFQRAGNQHVTFRRIVEYPFFSRSELSNGVQLADLLAYSMYRACRDENFAYSYFERLLPHIYRRATSPTLDGLKVWPEGSPLIDWARQGWQTFKSRKTEGK